MSQQGYVYLILDQINNKKYVGYKTGTPEESENYYGSGRIIKQKVKKHGKKFFKKIILGSCCAETKKDLKTKLDEAEREAIWIFRSFGSDGENHDDIYGYNLTKGGEGILGYEWTNAQKINQSINCKDVWNKNEHPRGFLNHKHTQQSKDLIKNKNSKPKRDKSNYKGSKPGVGKGLKRSQEYVEFARKKMIGNTFGKANKGKTNGPLSEAHKLKLSIKFSGTNNPMYGSTYVWYTNGKNNKRCTSENIETLISLGYYKGKTEKRKN